MPKRKLIFFSIIFLLFIPAISSAAYTHLLWERPIKKALDDRDDYYQKLDISHDKATFKMFWTPKGREVLKKQLELHIDTISPWYSTDLSDKLVTPEWIFMKTDLKRFEE